jgi:hypothetical protein
MLKLLKPQPHPENPDNVLPFSTSNDAACFLAPAMPWPGKIASGPFRTSSPSCSRVWTLRRPANNPACGLPLTCAPSPNDALPVPCLPPHTIGFNCERNATNQDRAPPGPDQKKQTQKTVPHPSTPSFSLNIGLRRRPLCAGRNIGPLVAAVLAPEASVHKALLLALMDDDPHRLAPHAAEIGGLDARPRHPLKEGYDIPVVAE